MWHLAILHKQLRWFHVIIFGQSCQKINIYWPKSPFFARISFSVLLELPFLHVQQKYACIIAINDVTWLPHRYFNIYNWYFKDFWYVGSFSCVYKCCSVAKFTTLKFLWYLLDAFVISLIPWWCYRWAVEPGPWRAVSAGTLSGEEGPAAGGWDHLSEECTGWCHPQARPSGSHQR